MRIFLACSAVLLDVSSSPSVFRQTIAYDMRACLARWVLAGFFFFTDNYEK